MLFLSFLYVFVYYQLLFQWNYAAIWFQSGYSHWDRYLGMTAAMTQIPVPLCMRMYTLIYPILLPLSSFPERHNEFVKDGLHNL